MKIIAIIPAGGHGSRFQSNLPKQYHSLLGKPIIIRTLQAFLSCKKIDKIIVNISPDFRDFLLEEFEKNKIDVSRIELLTTPGKERQETVLNALHNSEYVKDAEYILIHDAVRCMVSSQLIDNIINEVIDNHAVCPGLVPKNTIKEVDKGAISVETLNRSMLREIQTPQAYKKDIIYNSYVQADCDGFLGTDSASLVERMGINVKVIEGEEQNFKITTPMDFIFAEFLLTKKIQKFMIIGVKGQLGREFAKYCEKEHIEFTEYDVDSLNICDKEKVFSTVMKDKPTIIINCAAYNDVDKAELQPEYANAVNGEGPKILAEVAKEVGAKLVHYSTDFVFDGESNIPYTEDSKPNPINQYGKSKLLGEKNIRNVGGDYLIIRTSRVVGEGKQNFPYRFSMWAKDKTILTITDDLVSRSTSTSYLVEKTISALRNEHKGLLHLADGKAMSLFDWAKKIANEKKMSITLVPVKHSDFEYAAPRPRYSVLESKFDY